MNGGRVENLPLVRRWRLGMHVSTAPESTAHPFLKMSGIVSTVIAHGLVVMVGMRGNGVLMLSRCVFLRR